MKKRFTGVVWGCMFIGAVCMGGRAEAKTISISVTKADAATAAKIEKYVKAGANTVKVVCKGSDKLSAAEKKNALKKAGEIRVEYDLVGNVVNEYTPTKKQIQAAYKKNLQAAKKKKLKASVKKLKMAVFKKIGNQNGYAAAPRATGTLAINYSKKTGTYTITKNDAKEYACFFEYVETVCKSKKISVTAFKKKTQYAKLGYLLQMSEHMAYGLSNDTNDASLADNLQRMCKGTAKGTCEEFHALFDFFCTVMGVQASPVTSGGYVISALAIKNDAGKNVLLIGDRGTLSKYTSEEAFKTYVSNSPEISAKTVKEQFKDYPF